MLPLILKKGNSRNKISALNLKRIEKQTYSKAYVSREQHKDSYTYSRET